MERTALPRWWKQGLVLALLCAAIGAGWAGAHAGTALIVSHDLAAPDAILMLASHEWERLPAAAALAKKHPDALVLLTVPRVVTPYNCHECGERLERLEAQGVPVSRIRVLPRRVKNTHEEALALRTYAGAMKLSGVLIVTSPYHTRRTWATFTRVFSGSTTRLGVAPAAGARGTPERWWASAYDRHYVAYEWAASLNSWVRY